MAKKKKFSYKGLVINPEELSITKIGEMPNESKSPIFLFFVFGIFIIFIFFLPDIEKYFRGEDSAIIDNNTPSENESSGDNTVSNDLVYYDLTPTLTVNLEEGIVANQFSVENNSLSFTVTNHLTSRYYFNKKNYFIELYDENRTLLQRIILTKDALGSNEAKLYTYELSKVDTTQFKQIVFVEKNIEDYPNITLSLNEAKQGSLVCKKNDETITYTFNGEELSKISDVVSKTKLATDLNYDSDAALWQTRAQMYNAIEGVTSSYVPGNGYFMFNAVIDLENAKVNSIGNENYYEYKTLAKVIDFEMKARGFECN